VQPSLVVLLPKTGQSHFLNLANQSLNMAHSSTNQLFCREFWEVMTCLLIGQSDQVIYADCWIAVVNIESTAWKRECFLWMLKGQLLLQYIYFLINIIL